METYLVERTGGSNRKRHYVVKAPDGLYNLTLSLPEWIFVLSPRNPDIEQALKERFSDLRAKLIDEDDLDFMM